MATLTPEQELLDLRSRLSGLEESANAEAAFRSATGTSGRWEGASERLNAAKTKIRELELQVEGQELSAAVQRLANLDAELAKADEARHAEDRKLAEMTVHPTISKWMQAPRVARQSGYGHSWLLWSDWYLSNRGPRSGMPECGTFFLGDECPNALRFNIEDDRVKVREYSEQRGACIKAIVVRDSIAAQRAALLRERPELAS